MAIGLAVFVAIRIASRRPVALPVAALIGLLMVYSVALVGVSAASGNTNLKPGDLKCFDEWCAAMVSAQPDQTATTLAVRVRLENHGRGAQTSILARAFVESGGQRFLPRNPDDLQVLVPGGGTVDLILVFTLPASLSSGRFVVTEATSGEPTPGAIVIGDESSPFHSIAGWPLGESVPQVGP